MSDDAMDLNDEGVEAAAKAISSVRYTAARQRANGQFVDEQDEFKRMALAAAPYLRAVPESDEQRDKADQWDAAQPMIAAMTEHLTDYRYWRDNYLTSIEVGKEMLAERDATITRLEAEVEHPSWLYSSNPTTWPEWAQTWQADYLTATTALAAAEAEVATLREALERITNVPGNRGDYAIEIARSSLATPTATAREGGASE